MPERGYTYTEQHRHECEVRHVLALPSRWARAEYLNGIERKRGQAAADRLRRDLAAAWEARRSGSPTPPPSGEQPGLGVEASVHLGVNAPLEEAIPKDGSFLDPGHGGNSDPDRCVESGVVAR